MSRLTLVFSALAVVALAGLTGAAPVPPDPAPDPLGRGYLGVTVPQNGLVIESIQPNLPAARAGLRSGDKFVRVGSLEPHSFEQVIATICAYRPGATVEIEIERGSERKVFRIKLTTRPASADDPNRGGFPIIPD